MNNVVLVGSVVGPVVIERGADQQFVRNSIEVRNNRKNENGSYSTDLFNFFAVGNVAFFFSRNVKQGDTVALKGKLQNRTLILKEAVMVGETVTTKEREIFQPVLAVEEVELFQRREQKNGISKQASQNNVTESLDEAYERLRVRQEDDPNIVIL